MLLDEESLEVKFGSDNNTATFACVPQNLPHASEFPAMDHQHWNTRATHLLMSGHGFIIQQVPEDEGPPPVQSGTRVRDSLPPLVGLKETSVNFKSRDDQRKVYSIRSVRLG